MFVWHKIKIWIPTYYHKFGKLLLELATLISVSGYRRCKSGMYVSSGKHRWGNGKNSFVFLFFFLSPPPLYISLSLFVCVCFSLVWIQRWEGGKLFPLPSRKLCRDPFAPHFLALPPVLTPLTKFSSSPGFAQISYGKFSYCRWGSIAVMKALNLASYKLSAQ